MTDDDIKLTPYSNGTSDLSTFGKNDDIQLTATEKVVSCKQLINDDRIPEEQQNLQEQLEENLGAEQEI